MPHIPEPPDFSSLEAIAPKTAEQRTTVLALIGNLVFSWSNNESLLIYILAILLRTDDISAAVVFNTLNTTRARIELIQRLAQLKVRDQDVAAELDRLMGRFNKASRLRNELNHCLYSHGPQGEISHTQTMKLHQVKGQLRWGDIKPMDEQRMKQIVRSIEDLKRLNREIWAFLPILQQACGTAEQPSREPPG